MHQLNPMSAPASGLKAVAGPDQGSRGYASDTTYSKWHGGANLAACGMLKELDVYNSDIIWGRMFICLDHRRGQAIWCRCWEGA